MGGIELQIEKDIIETSYGKLEYSIMGSGQPTIVLINGGSGPIEGWMRILPELSKLSTVFSFNRFGVGKSDKPKEAQDGTTIVHTLREALSSVGLKPPFLLVGHSLGGFYANLFARLYPNEVAGVVLLEASHSKDTTLNEYQGRFVKALNKLLSKLSPPHPHDEVHFVQKTVEQINQNHSFPEVPLFIITGGKENRMMPAEARRKRLENQVDFLSLSKYSKHIIAERSGHFPQLTEPSVVVEAIEECLNEIHNR